MTYIMKEYFLNNTRNDYTDIQENVALPDINIQTWQFNGSLVVEPCFHFNITEQF